ncbi:uncharacterized protein Atf6 isoform X2 [Panulirus ornatus]|uniref:uncharacterized protein Atf6 isoform X2 n=1 Tax=Panulirus ornatus TaxID=150431 RepID=UPI003A8BD4EE
MSASVILDIFAEEDEEEDVPLQESYPPETQESFMETGASFMRTGESFVSSSGTLTPTQKACGVSYPATPDAELPSSLPLFSHLLSDVSESSSDDDLIFKLSHDLEMPMTLDDMEPVSSWSPEPRDIFQSLSSNDSLSSAHRYEGELTADELTRALYPNLEAGSGGDTRSVNPTKVEDDVKEEPNSPQHFLQMPPSPDDKHDIWELLLCGSDVKPNVKALDTPPVTPPQSESSPPHSPQPPSPVGLTSTNLVLSPTQQQQLQKQVVNSTTANQITQPIKVVTITTKNGGPGATKGGRITKTMKIQPKVVTTTSTQPQVISIVNSSSGAKLTLPKTVTRTIPAGGARIVQVKAPPVPPQVTASTTTTITNPFSSLLTTQIGSQPTVTSVTPSSLAPLAPALAPGMKHDNIPDLKALKRQQRMIKNRESASLSRKKKKEYLTALEGNITELQKENQKLKEENLRLQQRVALLETECANLRQSVSRGPSRKTTTALFALIFLFSLNLGPLSSVLLSSESKLNSLKTMMQGSETPSSSLGYHQRSLLWSSDDLTSAEDGNTARLATNASHTCPMYINATESLRLETELRGWFEHKFRPSKMDKKKDEKPRTSHPKTKEGRNGLASRGHMIPETTEHVVSEVWNALVPPSPPPARLFRYVHPDVLQVEPPTSGEEETAVMTTVPRLSSFLEAIQRRDDTYYVVSFSPDHLLVPATARNDSARPRMSLLMPTPRPMNESLAPPNDHIAMMQIDCEVIHTRLVHVSEEVVPVYLRAGSNNASHPSSDDTASHRQERRNGRARSRPFLPKPTYPTK